MLFALSLAFVVMNSPSHISRLYYIVKSSMIRGGGSESVEGEAVSTVAASLVVAGGFATTPSFLSSSASSSSSSYPSASSDFPFPLNQGDASLTGNLVMDAMLKASSNKDANSDQFAAFVAITTASTLLNALSPSTSATPTKTEELETMTSPYNHPIPYAFHYYTTAHPFSSSSSSFSPFTTPPSPPTPTPPAPSPSPEAYDKALEEALVQLILLYASYCYHAVKFVLFLIFSKNFRRSVKRACGNDRRGARRASGFVSVSGGGGRSFVGLRQSRLTTLLNRTTEL
jgi:hypothetical protein